jgi:hypothetical protein
LEHKDNQEGYNRDRKRIKTNIPGLDVFGKQFGKKNAKAKLMPNVIIPGIGNMLFPVTHLDENYLQKY